MKSGSFDLCLEVNQAIRLLGFLGNLVPNYWSHDSEVIVSQFESRGWDIQLC